MGFLCRVGLHLKCYRWGEHRHYLQRGVDIYCLCPACVGLRLNFVVQDNRRQRALLSLPAQPFGE
jgi:hypothetical protein